ncbi:MAG: UDP-N-acetylmuramate dehydrogenase [Clostridia bacterium]|nr:UDP-N-acetylmuramate dehydrogenase [Clostridia bacterium]
MKFKAFEEFCKLNKIKYQIKEPMSEHTSFKIGGPADFFVNVASNSQLKDVLLKLKELEIPYFIIGKGSNLLVSDKGIEGAVISLSLIDDIKVEDDVISAGAGASLAAVCVAAANNSLSGLEFAYGIPASVGGALYMNAGAYGGEMKDAVIKAEYVTKDGEIGEISLGEMCLGYRTSIFKQSEKIITRVYYKLKKGDKTEIRSAMDDFMGRRKSKQPLEFPSAGSTFKRPVGYFAGALIEQNNLKGVSVGGAMVSEKHAGFVINYNNATCNDVKQLMEHIRQTVLKAESVELHPEVIFVGRE